MYESRRRTVDVSLGRQKIPVETKELLIGFLERPNISYCKPGRGDTVYCGENEIYKCKHYLLWTFKELVELYNADRDDGSDEISYYFLRSTVEAKKHIFKVSDTAEDYFPCEKCENLELLISIRRSIRKENKDLAKLIPINPETFITQLVWSAKNFKCCNEECFECPEKAAINLIKCVLKTLPEVIFAKLVVVDGHNKIAELSDSGENIAELLQYMIPSSLKLHIHNFFCQHSESKYLKSQLGEEEVICSVDFSKNYENKQKHDIQSPHFGHEAFTLFTAACYYKPTWKENEKVDASGLVAHSVVIVSNETIHERNIAFSWNMKLLDYLKSINLSLKRVYFWSDGYVSQFRSKYMFRSLSFYPSWLKIFWDYGEAHHFKGLHDGISGTIKRKVYQHVSSGKVITDAKQIHWQIWDCSFKSWWCYLHPWHA